MSLSFEQKRHRLFIVLAGIFITNALIAEMIGGKIFSLEKTMGIMPGTTICGLADGTAWSTRTFINKFYDEFAAVCPEEPVKRTPLTISRGKFNVSTPMGSNTR